MSERTGIEWTDHTFNIAWGCMKVSPSCANCYAETWAKWTHKTKIWGPAATTDRRTFGERHWGEPLEWNALAEHEGRRHRVFCSSMADVFEPHPTIDAERAKLWPLVRATPWLDWQILTKRPENIVPNLPADWGERGYDNVWLGTSVESPDYLLRVDLLRQVPARIYFLSLEPLLRGLILSEYSSQSRLTLTDIEWVIVGGESGPKARPFDVQWAKDIINECRRPRTQRDPVPVFVKQLGAKPFDGVVAWKMVDRRFVPTDDHAHRLAGFGFKDKKGGDMAEWPRQLRVREYPVSATEARS